MLSDHIYIIHTFNIYIHNLLYDQLQHTAFILLLNTQPHFISLQKALNLFISTQFIYFIVADNQDGAFIYNT